MVLQRSIATRGFGTGAGSGTPTLPGITVANNNDGTATVTIATTAAQATNTVRVMRVDSQWPSGEWTDTGASRTGNGTVNVTLSSGVYWFSVTSVLGTNEASSAPVYCWVSDGADPILCQIIDAVVSKIRGLSLSGITSDKVIDRTAIDAGGIGELDEAKIVVFPLDQESLLPYGPTNADYIGYHILVAIAAPANRSHTAANRKLWFGWRERIRKALITDGISTATGVVPYTQIQSTGTYERRFWERNGFVSVLHFVFASKEQRV